MIPETRKEYNKSFTQAKYDRFFQACEERFDKKIEFKVCETPVFIPADFKSKLIKAGEEIIDIICKPDFIERSNKAIPNA